MSLRHIQFDDSAVILAASITNTYANLLALSDDADILFVENSTDQPILLSIPSGYNKISKTVVYKNIRFSASCSRAIDCRANSKRIAKGTIQIKYATGAPNTGEVVITAAR